MEKRFGRILQITIFGLLVVLSGCNPSKKAAKLFYRGMKIDAPTIYSECGKVAPPLDSQWDSTGFAMGETILLEPEYIYVDCDTVVIDSTKPNRVIKIPCPPCKTRVDTFYKYNTKQVVNRAKEYALEAENKGLNIELAKKQKALSIALWSLIILGAYTLLRWVLRYWGIKLP